MATTTQSIADLVDGKLVGRGDLAITGVEQVQYAQPGQLTFIGDERFAERWLRSNASAALVSRGVEVEPIDGKALIFVDNSDLAMARVLELYAPPPILPADGIDPTAVIDPSAKLGNNVRIGPHCVVGADVTLGDGCMLYSNVTILAQSRLGDGCVVWPGAVIRERCAMGDRCIIHSNAVLGADGFGYRPDQRDGRTVLVRMPHIGSVRLGDDVEIGAGTCVDRGKFSATFIDNDSKLDNLVQVGHNCRIGKCVVIAGCTAVAGSVTVGDGAMIGGMAAIRDHIKIGEGARISGAAQVMRDVPAGETWAGSPAQPLKQAARQALALQRLPDLVKQFKGR